MEKANSPEYQMSFPFKAGDLIIFDNRRILHGRTAYDPKHSGDRDHFVAPILTVMTCCLKSDNSSAKFCPTS